MSTSISTPIPSFTLYGDPAQSAPELLHIEDISSRSRGLDWEIQPHVHKGIYQIVWIADGHARIALDTGRREADGPVAVAIPPGTVHGFSFTPETRGWVLTLGGHGLLDGDLARTGDALRTLFSAPVVVPLARDDAVATRLGALFEELTASFLTPGLGGSPVLHWLSQAILWHLSQALVRDEAANPRASGHQALFTRFALLVEAHHTEHWPVARYAAQLGMSSPRLNRLTREQCGLTALEMIHERVTREACRQLLYTSEPVTTVATGLGFEDPAYFCRFIKRRTGLSPSLYRHSQGE